MPKQGQLEQTEKQNYTDTDTDRYRPKLSKERRETLWDIKI